MKATGIVRRIDDLGRIVIPKEIRRTLKINEGDSLEIFVDDSSVVLKKYSMLDNMLELADKIVSIFYRIYKKNILITDKEKVIASSKNIENIYLNNNLSNSIKESINKRLEVVNDNSIINGINVDKYFLLPIIVNSDAIGSIIMINDIIDDNDKNILRLINAILVKNVEE